MAKNASCPGISLGEQRNWALFHHMHQLHELIIKELDQRLSRATGLTFSQSLVLLSVHTLKANPSTETKTVAQTSIAKLLLCREATISRHIKKLVEMGFLASSEDPNKRSAHKITLTEKGRRHLRDSFHIINEALAQFFAQVSAAEKDNIFSHVEQIVLSIDPSQKLMCEQQIVKP